MPQRPLHQCCSAGHMAMNKQLLRSDQLKLYDPPVGAFPVLSSEPGSNCQTPGGPEAGAVSAPCP